MALIPVETASTRTPLFVGGHQTPGTGIVGQASFAATTPTFILDAGTKRLVVLRVTVSQMVAGGADMGCVFAADAKARYASGGASLGAKNTDLGSSVAATASLYGGDPTAAAAGSSVIYFGERLIDNTVATTTVIEFPGGIIIPKTAGSFLGYFWSASSDATLGVTVEWLEV